MAELVALDDLTETPHAEVFDGDPRTVRLKLAAGEGVATHRHPGTTVLFHVVSGALTLTLDDETYDLDAGDIVRFDGEREVSPEAVDDSVAVVVFVPNSDDD
ncbi:Cupin domain-containing protein [Halogranum gelatinilyticum]|uniref:Cupin domain-containing protein n=1 Tax=Halogranum gelatinilyticum TaxID=660521 RepID=A0A1G9YMF2_9EURY|nr:cupin domain-containing protein [Halogranum gelatinilyticum]SDN10389.1 Cupin domain-containing protein [Halogranum gelatinilyticum]